MPFSTAAPGSSLAPAARNHVPMAPPQALALPNCTVIVGLQGGLLSSLQVPMPPWPTAGHLPRCHHGCGCSALRFGGRWRRHKGPIGRHCFGRWRRVGCGCLLLFRPRIQRRRAAAVDRRGAGPYSHPHPHRTRLAPRLDPSPFLPPSLTGTNAPPPSTTPATAHTHVDENGDLDAGGVRVARRTGMEMRMELEMEREKAHDALEMRVRMLTSSLHGGLRLGVVDGYAPLSVCKRVRIGYGAGERGSPSSSPSSGGDSDTEHRHMVCVHVGIYPPSPPPLRPPSSLVSLSLTAADPLIERDRQWLRVAAVREHGRATPMYAPACASAHGWMEYGRIARMRLTPERELGLMADPGIKKPAEEQLRSCCASSGFQMRGVLRRCCTEYQQVLRVRGLLLSETASASSLVSDVYTNPSPLEAAPRVSAGFFNLYYNAHSFVPTNLPMLLILNHTTGTINVSWGWKERAFAQLSVEDPPGLVRLMRRMLVLDPAKWASAQELLDDPYFSR
ncbi:hypothetical protein B0H13DRAFT_2286755 [Mycena leptocephala]|nr:hypothetical protein B0H13DRAFT_2286755 [Mycena leptocephala]